MKHTQIQDRLSAFRDGELSEKERKAVEGHLKQCLECQRSLENWGRIGERLSRAVISEHSDYFVNQTMERVAALERQPVAQAVFGWPKWLAPAFGYAFALSLVFAAIIAREPILNVEANTETVLLTQVPQTTEWTFSVETPEVGKLFDLKEEI